MGKVKATPGETEQQTIARLKREWLAYYEALPIKRAACDFIGRDVNTVLEWEKKDPVFRDAVLKAKATYVAKHGAGRPDHLLPRLYDDFKPDKDASDAPPTAVNIIYVSPHDQLPADPQAGSGVGVSPQPDDQ